MNVKQSRAMFPGCVQFFTLKKRTSDLRNSDIPVAVLFRIGIGQLHNFIAVHSLCSSQLYYAMLLWDTAFPYFTQNNMTVRKLDVFPSIDVKGEVDPALN
jgi:hypothetical protein